MEIKCANCDNTDIIAYVKAENLPLCGECFKKFMAGDITLTKKEMETNA